MLFDIGISRCLTDGDTRSEYKTCIDLYGLIHSSECPPTVLLSLPCNVNHLFVSVQAHGAADGSVPRRQQAVRAPHLAGTHDIMRKSPCMVAPSSGINMQQARFEVFGSVVTTGANIHLF